MAAAVQPYREAVLAKLDELIGVEAEFAKLAKGTHEKYCNARVLASLRNARAAVDRLPCDEENSK
jgi:hypothetical protein